MGIYKGYKQTKEHIDKKAKSKKRGKYFNCEICKKIFWRRPSSIKKGNNKCCSRKCYFEYQKGRKKKFGKRPHLIGKNNHRWKGGITPLNTKIRNSEEYKKWRLSVFARDEYACVLCGVSGSKKPLNADHIKPFADYQELRFDINNGRTLCIDCHKQTKNYGWKYYNKTRGNKTTE